MQDAEAVFVLVPETFAGQHRKHFFGREAASPLDQIVRHLGPAIRKTVERVLRGKRDQVVLAQRKHLPSRGGGREQSGGKRSEHNGIFQSEIGGHCSSVHRHCIGHSELARPPDRSGTLAVAAEPFPSYTYTNIR